MYIAQWALHLLHVQYEDSLNVYSSVGPSFTSEFKIKIGSFVAAMANNS